MVHSDSKVEQTHRRCVEPRGINTQSNLIIVGVQNVMSVSDVRFPIVSGIFPAKQKLSALSPLVVT